ncbi:hypothetical protein SACC_25740 [Saccharolobus caldissimus]|uniref:SirA family protein n=1 Tax=Saccharolobus caldissimus TaxID=1702097 RepID=A0AAQ4CUS6_9CREN|nr:hypothetical protein SACC_25740 [Saccharolobus caldissimus]
MIHLKIYKTLDYTGVTSCDNAIGEIFSSLEDLKNDEVLQVILDADWKFKELKEFISKTKYKILDVKKEGEKYIIIIGGKS